MSHANTQAELDEIIAMENDPWWYYQEQMELIRFHLEQCKERDQLREQLTNGE